MRQVLFMAVLAAGMLLAGCSKEEDNGMGTKNGTEQVLADMKQHIVGTWEHDGDFICADLSELSGTIKDGIITGCASTFEDYNPAILTFRNNGSFELLRDYIEPNRKYTGTYVFSLHYATGKPIIGLLFDEESSIHAEISMFKYSETFFEADYNTVYLVAHDWATIVSRYRRK